LYGETTISTTKTGKLEAGTAVSAV